MNRIQKIILNEYSELEDTVLIESPFAQVTLNGMGIRQVQIALTPTKLLIGTDIIRPVRHYNPRQLKKFAVDPEIETFELISAIPLGLINLSVINDHTYRSILKISFGIRRQLFFEFGGYFYRNIHFNMWKDTIDLLRAFQNKLPCAEFLSQQSVCSEVDYELQNITQISYPSNVSNSLQSQSNSMWEFGKNYKLSEYSQLISISNQPSNQIDNRKSQNVFKTLKNFFVKQRTILDSTQVSPNEKCQDYLMRINVPTYGSAK